MTAQGRLLGRGMAFPPQVGPDGSVAWSEGEQNVREDLRILLLTEPGERPRLPEYGAGLRALLFEPNTAVTRHLVAEVVRRAVEQWEPRVRVVAVDVEPDPLDRAAATATLQYEFVATADVAALTVSVALRG